MTAMRAIHLYGELADRFGPYHDVFAPTLTAGLRIIECNHPGFLYAVRKGRFHVAKGDTPDDAVEMPLHHLMMPTSHGDWHLVPMMAGGKGGTFKTVFSIIVGGALLATGIGGAVGLAHTAAALGGQVAGGALAASSGVLGLSYATVSLIGASFFLGGINNLLTQQPKTDTSGSTPTAFSFGGPTETETEGGPIQIIIGEVICSGIRAASAVESSNSASVSQYSDFNLNDVIRGVGGIYKGEQFSFFMNN